MRINMNKKIKYTVGILILIIFCLWFFEGRYIHTKVGGFKIYKKDIEYRNKIIKLQYPEEKQDFGLLQLQKSYINYRILKNHNYASMDERLKSEAERIDQKTKNPAMLKKIKEIFGKDKEAYQRVFVAPAAIDEVIYYNFFTQQMSLHDESQKKAEKVLEELKSSNEPLKEKAKKDELAYKIIQVSLFEKIQPVDLKTMKPLNIRKYRSKEKNKQEDPLSKYWIDVILKDLKDGDLIQEVVSIDDRWMVGRFIKKINKDTYQIELIDIPKKSFSQFVAQEAKNVSIKTGFFIF